MSSLGSSPSPLELSRNDLIERKLNNFKRKIPLFSAKNPSKKPPNSHQKKPPLSALQFVVFRLENATFHRRKHRRHVARGACRSAQRQQRRKEEQRVQHYRQMVNRRVVRSCLPEKNVLTTTITPNLWKISISQNSRKNADAAVVNAPLNTETPTTSENEPLQHQPLQTAQFRCSAHSFCCSYPCV